MVDVEEPSPEWADLLGGIRKQAEEGKRRSEERRVGKECDLPWI